MIFSEFFFWHLACVCASLAGGGGSGLLRAGMAPALARPSGLGIVGPGGPPALASHDTHAPFACERGQWLLGLGFKGIWVPGAPVHARGRSPGRPRHAGGAAPRRRRGTL